MNENAKAWIAALRSGEYQQGQGQLTRVLKDGTELDCCLGVACKLYYGNEGGQLVQLPSNFRREASRTYGSTTETYRLPNDVRDWLGLSSNNGEFLWHKHQDDEIDEEDSLSHLNDGDRDFMAIAALIAAEPTGLFVEASA